MSQTVGAFRSFSKGQRERFGAVALLVGIALIMALGFVTVPSELLQILIGVFGVLVMVVGTLLVGTSDGAV